MRGSIKSAVLSRNGWLTLLAVTVLSAVSSEAFQAENKSAPGQQKSINMRGSKTAIQDKRVTLESLIEEALDRNLKIKTQENHWESSKLKIPQAGAWMDPKLNVSIMNFPYSDFTFSSEPMTQKQISLTQTFPFPGITSLKERVAEQESETVAYLVSDTRNGVVKGVSIAYYDLFFIDKSIEITLKNKQLLNEYIINTSKKYEVGIGLQQDVFKAQVAFSKLLDKLISLRKRREAITVRLNSLLNRPMTDTVGELSDIKHEQVALDMQSLQSIAVANRPMLQALGATVDRNRTAYELALKQNWPEFGVGLVYGQRDNRRDFFTVRFSVGLPLWKNRKQDKKIDESLSDISAAESMYEDSRTTIYGQVGELVALLEESDERLELLKNVIIPQATQSLISATSAYQVNRIDFLTLLNNQITLFDFEVNYFRLLTEYKKNLSNLEFVVGQPLTN